jgi:hypothetical protein
MSRSPMDDPALRPPVIVTYMIDLTQLLAQPPDVKTLAVLVKGNRIEWQAKFRRAMGEVCKARAVSPPIPPRLKAAAVPSRGILLLWPVSTPCEPGFPVEASPAGRRITTDLTEAFGALGMNLPDEIAAAVPVTRYLHGTYGECLALHFQRAEFLPEKSRTAAGFME